MENIVKAFEAGYDKALQNENKSLNSPEPIQSKSLYESGVRPAIDNFLLEASKERRDYGDYWSASSAGYCMRKVIFDRLGVDYVTEDARKQKVFTAGHIFHEWMQRITKDAGISLAQEIELKNDDLHIIGHIDDIISTDDGLILYDYKTQNSRAFSYKRPEMNYYHRMQLGTYLLMLKDSKYDIKEGRILKISKDDLRMSEEQLILTEQLEAEVLDYWTNINKYFENKKMPVCTCADHEGGFMAKETYNPYFYKGEPCSVDWYYLWKERNKDE